MKLSGYAFATPLQVPGFGLSPQPTSRETGMARTDLARKWKTRLIPTRFTVESPIQKSLISNNEEALTQARNEEQKALKNAASVLAKG